MEYIRIIFDDLNSEMKDILVAELSILGFEGFEEHDSRLLAYMKNDKFDHARVIALSETYNIPFTKDEIEEQNWNAVWESNYEPVLVNDYCVIRAHFHPVPGNVKHDIVITPKMSFGTGHHATTYMMITNIQKIDLKNKHVFDFGTGTGILAILSEKEGAAKVIAVDNDDWSITNARENIERNDCSKISLVHTSEIPNEKFDVILANINRNVIVSYSERIVSALTTTGILLVSGIVEGDEEIICDTFTAHSMAKTDRISQKGWLCLRFDFDV